MKGRIGVLIISLLLALYLVVLGGRGIAFLQTGIPVAIAIGVAVLVLPFIGAWALVRELWFGVRSEQLVRRLDAEGNLPLADLPTRPSGRPIRAAADADFPQYRDAVAATPTDWRAWFLLGLAYDASGDRRRARGAIRSAITLERAEKRAAARAAK
jgi:cytochrome c-type biogenesis protein CcmH/NrfG